jgi:hypothetical protein
MDHLSGYLAVEAGSVVHILWRHVYTGVKLIRSDHLIRWGGSI